MLRGWRCHLASECSKLLPIEIKPIMYIEKLWYFSTRWLAIKIKARTKITKYLFLFFILLLTYLTKPCNPKKVQLCKSHLCLLYSKITRPEITFKLKIFEHSIITYYNNKTTLSDKISKNMFAKILLKRLHYFTTNSFSILTIFCYYNIDKL